MDVSGMTAREVMEAKRRSSHGEATLRGRIRDVLNECSAESESGTPDFILAAYLGECLNAFEGATAMRDAWRGWR